MKKDSITLLLWLLHPECTDEMKPVDAGYGRLVKAYVAQTLDEWLLNGDNVELAVGVQQADRVRSSDLDHAMDRQGRQEDRQRYQKPHVSIREDGASDDNSGR